MSRRINFGETFVLPPGMDGVLFVRQGDRTMAIELVVDRVVIAHRLIVDEYDLFAGPSEPTMRTYYDVSMEGKGARLMIVDKAPHDFMPEEQKELEELEGEIEE